MICVCSFLQYCSFVLVKPIEADPEFIHPRETGSLSAPLSFPLLLWSPEKTPWRNGLSLAGALPSEAGR